MSTPANAAPVSLTRFVGRDRELAELARLVPTTRLLTLTGAGGSGKTRLAGEAMGRAPSAFDHVAWADLAPIHEASRILPAIAAAIGVQARADSPTIESIIDAVGDRAVLVVLDNCEHVVDVCAGIAESLLRQCPRLTILATSREALGVPGETAWLVPPMREDEAVQLFVERAQSVLPSFSLTVANQSAVMDICRRLDGIPLAIELAAARVRVLSPQQIAERLSDAFSVLGGGSRTALARQRTLRGTIDWSFALLTPHEQQLLLRLSVFSGTFSIDAVEWICTGAPLDDASVLDELSGLVDKSLVVMEVDGDDARYRLLETVRQYADERLRTTPEHAAFRERHAHHFLELAERAEPRLFGGADDPTLVAVIAKDAGNLRAAFEWCDDDPSRVEWHLRGAYGLHWFWFARGQFEEGRLRLRLAQRHAANPALPVRLRGLSMVALGHIHVWQGNPQDAIVCMQQGCDLLEGTGEPFAIAYAHAGVGAAYYMLGDRTRAAAALSTAATRYHALPDHVLGSIIYYWIGRLHLESDELDAAERAFAEAAGIGRRIQNRPAKGHNQLMVGLLALRREQAQRAHTTFVDALQVLTAIGDVWGVAHGLEGVACALLSAQLFDTSAVLLGAATALRERIAAPHLPGDRERINAARRLLERTLARRFEDLWGTGHAMSREAATALAIETPWPAAAARVEVDAAAIAPTVQPASSTPVSADVIVAAVAGEPPSSRLDSVRDVAIAADLSVRVLAPLEILVGGQPVDRSAWGSARSRELLLYLVFHPSGVTKDQVGLAFWPDASAAQVRNTFHVTLHRLRKALGHAEWITVQQDRYRLDPALTIVCDALQFEASMSDALRNAKRRGANAAEALTSALALYTQDLLVGESVGDWHVSLHDRLQRLYFDGLQALSSLQLEGGDYADAIATSRRLLASDTLDEDAWRRIMTAHARSGERTHALRIYQQLVDLLVKEIDSTPDRATEKLAQRIRSGDPV
jgi:predicted ATPase/DNA-binding SARP family transcriptional activator